MATLPDGSDTGDLNIDDCIPDVPDVGSEIDKALQSAYGKIPDIDFRPVDFSIDISKYFDFNMFGKLLGRDGLGMDVCDHCTNGTGFDGMAAGSSLMPANETIDGINAGINENAQGIAENANNISEIEITPPAGAGGGTFNISLDSAVSFLFSNVVDSAEFDSDGLA